MFENTNDDDDDNFFAPVSSSKLASLFGVTMSQAQVPPVNTSLTYTAPKQPVKQDEAAKNCSKAKPTYSVILFKEVHAFKIVERNYLNQGKCGLALIGNDSVKLYQLLLYKQKTDIISTSKVYSQFHFIVQKDNYASYNDDQKQTWTIHFSSDSDLNEFVGLVEGKGGQIRNNQHQETTEEFNSETPNKLPLVFEKEQRQIDSDNQSDTSGSNVKANILSRMAKMGQKILLPNASISDGTDSDTDRDKSAHSKVSRKPKRAGTPSPTVASASNTPEISKKPAFAPSRSTSSISAAAQPNVAPQYSFVNGQYVPLQPQFLPLSTEIAPVRSSFHSAETPVVYTPVAQPMYDQFQLYFTENRTQNSEVRMSLLRLTNKVEEAMEKMQKVEERSGSKDQSKPEGVRAELEKVERNLRDANEIIQEQKLSEAKLLVKERNLREENEELRRKIGELEKPHRDFTAQEEFTQKEAEFSKREIEELSKTLAEFKVQDAKLPQKRREFVQTEAEFFSKRQIEELSRKLGDFTAQEELSQKEKEFAEKESEFLKLQSDFSLKQTEFSRKESELTEKEAESSKKEQEKEEKLQQLELRLQELTEKLKSFEEQNSERQTENPDCKSKAMEEAIKNIMNSLYHDISEELNDEESFSGKDIKRCLAKKIRDNTYSIIAAVNQIQVSKSNENILE